MTTSALHHSSPPAYFVDLPPPLPSQEASLEPIWLRPGPVRLGTLTGFCAFAETRQGLTPIGIPYTALATGSLRLGTPELPRPSGPTVLVLAARLPPCRGLALLSTVGGSAGPLFRGFVQLADAQVLRLPPRAL